jgi:N-acetylneuraminic acid mutarotase
MKTLYFTAIAIIISQIALAQSWTQKANFGGPGRHLPSVAVVGSNAYLCFGSAVGNANSADFWKYDANTDSWNSINNFPGTGRNHSVAFAIGNNVYVGIGSTFNGSNYTCFNDFWEYNTITNIWTQKANFGGGFRRSAFGFSINNKGYIGCGIDSNSNLMSDFWQYDPNTDTWSQKANFAGGARTSTGSFVIDSNGYVCTGDNGLIYKNDLWQYNPTSNAWTQKASYNGTPRKYTSCFSLNKKGYLCTGWTAISTELGDFWQYDSEANAWTQLPDFSGVDRRAAIGFAINNKGYITCGYDQNGLGYLNDLWEYSPAISNSINTRKSNLFYIYPNPAKNIVTINGALTYEEAEVSIYNTQNQLLIQQKISQNQRTINLDPFTRGIYFIKIDYLKNSTFEKLVIE